MADTVIPIVTGESHHAVAYALLLGIAKHEKKNIFWQGGKGKEPVVALVERDGRVRSQHMPEVTAKNLRLALVTQVDRKSYLMTDESGGYVAVGREFGGHGTVNHSIEEYVRGSFWHTNTVEGISRS